MSTWALGMGGLWDKARTKSGVGSPPPLFSFPLSIRLKYTDTLNNWHLGYLSGYISLATHILTSSYCPAKEANIAKLSSICMPIC